MTAGLNIFMFLDKFLSGSEILTVYPYFFNSFDTCNPVSRLIKRSFEIPPEIISIFFFQITPIS